MNPTNEQELRELAHIIMNADTPYDAMQFVKDHTNAEIAKVLDRAKQRFHEPIEHDGSYISISVIDKTFDELIQAERAKLKEVK